MRSSLDETQLFRTESRVLIWKIWNAPYGLGWVSALGRGVQVFVCNRLDLFVQDITLTLGCIQIREMRRPGQSLKLVVLLKPFLNHFCFMGSKSMSTWLAGTNVS
ncbi:hypothetical protein AMECASPLE_010918 [Ameca splendens]|uniref:Uncharacterized protein n=1 Tax=Ameca splendens TaxID=208324 RepID=A0ABV0ZWH5_9TELE